MSRGGTGGGEAWHAESSLSPLTSATNWSSTRAAPAHFDAEASNNTRSQRSIERSQLSS